MSNFNKWTGQFFSGEETLRSFKIGDRKATPDEQNVVEVAPYKEARDKEEYSEDFDRWMQSVDWSVVDKMVQEVVDKSGVQGIAVNNIWPGKIVNESDDPNSLGQFELNGNYIGLNNSLIDKIAGVADIYVDILRTQVLFHEIGHAASKHENQVSYKTFKTMSDILKEHFFKEFSIFRHKTTETLTTSGNYFVNEIKIHRNKEGKEIGAEENNFYSFLNDAITEKQSVEMLREYAKRTGKFSDAQMADYEKKYLYNEEANPGVVYLVFLDAILEVLSASTDTDKQIVWNGFVRGQFSEKPFEDSGVQEMFASAFYQDFLKDLSRVETSEDALKLFLKAIEKFKEEK